MKQQIHNYASLSVLQKVLLAAVNAIQSYDYRSARDLLKEASSIDIENPEIFNLLGICYEKEGDIIKRRRYYKGVKVLSGSLLYGSNFFGTFR